VLPLWVVPKKYDNRTQWPRHEEYPAQVSMPVRTLAASPRAARALVRYVEAKALLGGTTTGQGIRTRVEGGPKLFRGAMRNVEETNDQRLPEAGTRVPNLYPNEEGVSSFREGLRKRAAYFYHLAEGVDPQARKTFTDLSDNDLLQSSLVGVHCLGLAPEDLTLLAARGGKVVWSPFSNLLLYGSTLDLGALKSSGVTWSIGCDWSPSGSKNLLQELKVARLQVQAQGAALSSADLVRAVTASPASACGWQQWLGSLRPGTLADLVVIAGADGDPYDHLIDATEGNVQLVVTHGVPRYGDAKLMSQLDSSPDRPFEEITVGGQAKSFNFFTPGSDLNDLSFAAARSTLEEVMADLPALRAETEEQGAQLQSLDMAAPSFVLELDNEYEPTPDELRENPDLEAGLLADWNLMAKSVELDPPEVGGDAYWDRIDRQPNIDDSLKQALRSAYGG